MAMEMRSVESSNLDQVGYDPENDEMIIEFKGGARYSYHGIPPEVHDALVNADSVGKYFNENIKKVYTGTRI